ncbi:DUF4030 domain-containing protein [Priestia megaterium]|uniref:DUF4030 domain-containing protein n=1 Tax=Priestia megaterium TaxID=1404 RepID=UPI002D7E156A|nr:DUF4030 domain-containing protein [Priestia megaterium]MEB4861240.1 DUF4030 domain-containing protein [Priestia megaterium]MEB4872102.1 DUF4030 domain-containing protein [Priestia megaterium]
MKKRFNSFMDDSSLEKLNEELVWKSKRKQKQKQRLSEAIDQLERSESVKPRNNILPVKQNRLLRNVVYCGIALVILSGAFVSSAFVSPAMAQVAAKIPYLGELFKQEPVSDVLYKELEKKGYKIDSLGQTYYGGKKQIEISVTGSEKYFKSVKGDINKIANDMLEARHYDSYKVKITRYDPAQYQYKPDPRQEKYDKINEEIDKELKKHNYHVLSVNMGGFDPDIKVELEVPDTEKHIEEMKQIITDVLAKNKEEKMPIKVYKINLKKREQEGRWGNILNDVGEDLLGKEEYHVKMVGYSVHPEPQVFIYTSLSDSEENKQFANELEGVIDEFLQTEDMKAKIKGDSYKVIIYAKGKKKLN